MHGVPSYHGAEIIVCPPRPFSYAGFERTTYDNINGLGGLFTYVYHKLVWLDHLCLRTKYFVTTDW